MEMTRRTFTALTAAVAAIPTVSAGARNQGGKRWYKGQLHTHPCWSDGRALPEQAAQAYLNAGYDFLAITDHNRIGSDPDRWMPVGALGREWPPKVIDTPVFEAFRKRFPDARWRDREGRREVRMSTLAEIHARFNKPGKFLFMKGCEVTLAGPETRHLHLNYVGLDRLIPFVRNTSLIHGIGDAAPADLIRKVRGEVEALAAERNGVPHLFWVNHPHWTYYDVLPQQLIDNPEVRFFEICNTGSDAAPEGGLPRDGFDNDRLWDAVLATRCTRGEPLLYGIGVDDTHFYPDSGIKPSSVVFNDAWVTVRATALTPQALFTAMDRGDFYASCGVAFDDIAFNNVTGTLSLSVPAKPGVAHTVSFITTKRGAPLDPVKQIELPAGNGHGARTVPLYSGAIGAVAKEVTFAKGEPVRASYTLAGDDLYVRARVASDEPATYRNAINRMHPPVKVGWTQPYRKDIHRPVQKGK